jgi:hypothetical protein
MKAADIVVKKMKEQGCNKLSLVLTQTYPRRYRINGRVTAALKKFTETYWHQAIKPFMKVAKHGATIVFHQAGSGS